MAGENLCPIAFSDTETGGLDPLRHEILELGLMLTSPDGLTVLDEREWKIIPERPDLIDPRAAAVNGYTPEAWQNARPRREVMDEFCAATQGAICTGHNVGFDRAFIEAALRACDLTWPCRYRTVDTSAMAWPLVRMGLVPDTKLQTLAVHYGIDPGRAHSALSDARTCRHLYLRLMETWAAGIEVIHAPAVRRGPYELPVLVDPQGGTHAGRHGITTWCGQETGEGWLIITPIGITRGDPRGVAVPTCPECMAAARAAKGAP